MSRLTGSLVGLALALAWCCGIGPRRAAGQFGVRPLGRADGGALGEQARVQPPIDRTLSRGIGRAQESIARGEYVQAIQFLDEVLGRDGDMFVETDATGGFAGLKERARQMIRDLPPEGRQAYEAAFGPVAERELRQALAAGDATALERIANRYLYTPAGFEAALLAASDEADAGRHLSAALLYEQLLDTPEAVRRYDPGLSVRSAASWLAAGEPARAEKALGRLTARGAQTVEVAGREHRLDSTAEPLDWLREVIGEPTGAGSGAPREWITFRASGTRNGETRGGLPHMRVRWRVRLMNHPRLESLFEEFAANLEQTGELAPVASAPLAAGDYVLVRTPHGLLAVDFRTGKRIWRTEPQRDRELEQLVRGGAEEEATNPEAVRSFARRMWQDYLYGVPSSDGQRVYVIRDIPMPATVEYDVGPFLGGGAVETTPAANRLCAYDLATQGKLVWEIDGASAKGELAGAFFLGAPLAVGPSLYALAEVDKQIKLVALDRSTGDLAWVQRLADLETGVLLDLDRRLQSAMPSYDGGVLVCPTGAGLVVGVDLVKRSLAWAYRYDAAPRMEIIYRGGMDRPDGAEGRWTDGAATIVDGRVLITPPESRDLHCLDLRTGKLLWKRPRGAMRRLACVDGGKVLLVGNKSVTAVELADGNAAWGDRALDLPGGAAPSGSGFLSDGKYFLPLSTAEVAAIDVARGKIVAQAAARDGAALGNLICHRGSVISQNGMFLDCFDQIDVLRKRSERRLVKRPGDVEALRTLGEVAYNDGRLSDALSLLERAYQADRKDFETRDVLAECLAAALDENFAAYRSRLPLLKELEDGIPGRRLLILRIEAQGLSKVGEPLAAAEACFELYRLAEPSDEPLQINRDHHTAAAGWVAAQLASIWEQADAEQRQALESKAIALARDADHGAQGDSLKWRLDFFGTLPGAEKLKLELARQLVEEGRALEAQQALVSLSESADVETRGEATARLAAELHSAGQHLQAAELDRALASDLADVKCLDGATGRELVERWRKSAGSALAEWPRGKVESTSLGAAPASAGRVRSPLRTVRWERTDGILGRASALISAPARGGEMVMLDSHGREFFRSTLEQENPNQFRPPGNVYGVTHGSLMVLSLGRQLAAFNTLPTGDGATGAALWRVQLGNTLDFEQMYFEDPSGGAGQRPGTFRAGRSADHGNWIGVIGPVTGRSCVYQDQRRLTCVDVLTGEPLWWRSDVPPNCDLYGDERFVFAQPKDSTTAHVYSALDGRKLGEATPPKWEEQLATLGARVAAWRRTSDNGNELWATDLPSGEQAWRHEFTAGAKVDVDANRYVAVVEVEGRAVIVDAKDGRVIVDQKIKRQAGLSEIHLSAGRDGFTLIVHSRRGGSTDRVVRPFNPLDSSVVSGEVYAFDRDGGAMRWSGPAEVFEHALLVSQPADLPFIAFAGMLQTRGTSVLVLDKATGRTLYNGDDLPAASTGYCLARVTDEAKREAAIELGNRTVLLKFTDDRRPPEPPALVEVESSATKTSGGLMRIIQNLGEGR